MHSCSPMQKDDHFGASKIPFPASTTHNNPAALKSCCNLLSRATASKSTLFRPGSLGSAGSITSVSPTPSASALTVTRTASSSSSSIRLPPRPNPWRNNSLREVPRKPNARSNCETTARSRVCWPGVVVFSRWEESIPRSQRLTRQKPRRDVRRMNHPG